MFEKFQSFQSKRENSIEPKKGGNLGYDCVLGDLRRNHLGSYSEPRVGILYLTHEIATGVTCHKMSHILTYFAYFR